MSENECKTCKKIYNKNENKPYILSCGDTLCLKCIKNYKQFLNKEEFECPKCCNITKSLGVENKAAYPKEGTVDTSTVNVNQTPVTGEFEILIRPKGEFNKYSMMVTKSMTVRQLKLKIQKEKGYNFGNFDLAFKRPLANLEQTLESYGITKKVTLTQISNVSGGN